VSWVGRVDPINAACFQEFAEPVTFSHSAATDVVPASGGIFDEEHQALDLGGTIEVSATGPRVSCLTSEVAGVLQGWTATIRSIAYTVTDVRPAGESVTDFDLQRA
jgi:hypothetical protein